MVQGAVNEAERRHSRAQDDAPLVNELRAILYEGNDIFQSFQTEVKRRRNIRIQRVRNSLSSINPKRAVFRHELSKEIHQLEERLNNLIRLHNLNVQLGSQTPSATDTCEISANESFTALRGEGSIYGRNNDIEVMVGLLTIEENAMAKPSILPILGMAGMGKSTLALQIYHDERVVQHFDVCAWATVSHKFDIMRITRSIISSLDDTSQASIQTWGLNQLQSGLKKRLSGKRYLLVLDDIWNEEVRNWENLKKCLAGAQGSWILVTTRHEAVAKIVGTKEPYRLKSLSQDDCWLIFQEYAFKVTTTRSSNITKLSEIGFKIVGKCNGSPLAAKVLGNRLRIHNSIEKWQSVLDSHDEVASGEIMQSLNLSFQMLPRKMTMCFKYCSIFPKGYIFEKDVLVLLWMAQDYIKGEGSRPVESVGEEVFTCLEHSSFFQPCPSDPSKFVMHDLIHDLALEVSGNECCTIEDEGKSFPENVRHAAVLCTYADANLSSSSSRNHSTSYSLLQRSCIDSVCRCTSLYSLLLLGNSRLCTSSDLHRLYKSFKCLRTLDLSNSGITFLEDSVSNLKHLRFLNLSNTTIRSLPNSLNELYNLQTLLLRNCYELADLPKCMGSLRDLRHFDLSLDTDFHDFSDLNPDVIRTKYMPDGLEKHSQLQTLSKFVVSNKKRLNGIRALQNLNELHGDLCILNLHMISSIEAASGNLHSKRFIQRLKLQWADDYCCRQDMTAIHEATLAHLRPHQELKELRIEGYGGTIFPDWIHGLTNITKLTMSNCQSCELPTLGKLQFLKALCLRKIYSVENLDCKFCGNNPVRFPCLQRLEFLSLTLWKEWTGDQNCVFPHLQEVIIKDCLDLCVIAHDLPSQTTLTIENCQKLQFVKSLPILSFNVTASDELTSLSVSFPSLESLTLSELQATEQFAEQIISMKKLRYLEIKQCIELQYLPQGLSGLYALQEIKLHECTQLKSLPEDLYELHSLEVLTLSDCPSLHCLPRNGLPNGLQMLSIQNCPSLKERCKRYVGEDWQKIKSVRLIYLDEESYLCTH